MISQNHFNFLKSLFSQILTLCQIIALKFSVIRLSLAGCRQIWNLKGKLLNLLLIQDLASRMTASRYLQNTICYSTDHLLQTILTYIKWNG